MKTSSFLAGLALVASSVHTAVASYQAQVARQSTDCSSAANYFVAQQLPAGQACTPVACTDGVSMNCAPDIPALAAEAFGASSPYLMYAQYADETCSGAPAMAAAVKVDGQCHAAMGTGASYTATAQPDGSVVMEQYQGEGCTGVPESVTYGSDKFTQCVGNAKYSYVVPGSAPGPVPGPSRCGPGESEMSVEGVEGVFCVSGTPCVADISNGACPSATAGLPFGAYCAQVRTGVFGCRPYLDALQNTPAPLAAPLNCAGNAGGDTPVSVVGAGVFCARQPVCSGAINGNCPGPASGLTAATSCVVLPNSGGVYGCVLSA